MRLMLCSDVASTSKPRLPIMLYNKRLRQLSTFCPTLSRMSQGRKGAPVVAGKPRYEACGGEGGTPREVGQVACYCCLGWRALLPTQLGPPPPLTCTGAGSSAKISLRAPLVYPLRLTATCRGWGGEQGATGGQVEFPMLRRPATGREGYAAAPQDSAAACALPQTFGDAT